MKNKSILVTCAIVISLFAMGSFAPKVGAQDNSSENMLISEQVSPENEVWGENFTFQVTYVDNENNLPVAGYPKLYIDGQSENMVENDPLDNNTSDGKVYKYVWETGEEHIGNHSFHFYVRDEVGENDRHPENGSFEGPFVSKREARLNLDFERKGDNIVFSGVLRSVLDNEPLSEKEVIIYKVLREENLEFGTVETGENGTFTFTIKDPGDRGIFRFDARFGGGDGFKESRSDPIFLHELDPVYLILVPMILFFGIFGVLWYFLARKFETSVYLTPMIFGGLVGILLVSFLGIIGLLIGGLIIGYIISSDIRGWTNQLRIGITGGALAFAIYNLLTLVNIFRFPASIEQFVSYSLTQGAFIQSFLMGSGMYVFTFVLSIGLGTIFGEFLRKFFR